MLDQGRDRIARHGGGALLDIEQIAVLDHLMTVAGLKQDAAGGQLVSVVHILGFQVGVGCQVDIAHLDLTARSGAVFPGQLIELAQDGIPFIPEIGGVEQGFIRKHRDLDILLDAVGHGGALFAQGEGLILGQVKGQGEAVGQDADDHVEQHDGGDDDDAQPRGHGAVTQLAGIGAAAGLFLLGGFSVLLFHGFYGGIGLVFGRSGALLFGGGEGGLLRLVFGGGLLGSGASAPRADYLYSWRKSSSQLHLLRSSTRTVRNRNSACMLRKKRTLS